MKIAYCGNTRAPWCTEVHVGRSIGALGHEVVHLQEHDYVDDPMAMLDAAEGCDLFLYTKTVGLDPVRGLELWEKLEAAGIPTVSYHLDLYCGLDREAQLDYEPFWRTRYVFSADGGSDACMAAHGIDHTWLPAGVVADECVTGTPDPKHAGIDVGFVGSWQRYHPEWPYRWQLVEMLRRTYRRRFSVWPNARAGAVRGKPLNDLYASVPVFVGDSLCPDFTHERYWSDRVYETLGRGGFLIHPWIAGLETEFDDGVHLRFYEFGDFDELHGIIDDYVANPDMARQIAEQGQQRVRDRFTYTHRVQQMLDVLVERGALTAQAVR